MRACCPGRLLAAVLLVCLASPAAWAQAAGFNVDLVTRRAGATPRLDVYTDVPNTSLQFLARADGFEATYAVTVEARALDGDGRPGPLVLSRTFEREVRAPDYDATRHPGAADSARVSLGLPPGRYAVTVAVEDGASGRTFARETEHTVRDVGAGLAVSDPVLLARYDPATGEGAPIIGAVVSTEADAFWVACDVYADAPADLRVTYVVAERGEDRERPSFGALLGLAPRERADLGTPVAVTEPLAVAAGTTPAAFRVDASELEVGAYTLAVRLETAAGETVVEVEKPFAVEWTGLDRQLADLDQAVAQLRYVARESEIEAIRQAPTPEERLRRFRTFWSRRDPTPGTSRNERMEEYYFRVAAANERWSRPRNSGWSTDPGEVFIRFGEPDDVEEHEATYGTRPYQVWTYYGEGRRFIFWDETGRGEYRLVVPIWDERTRM